MYGLFVVGIAGLAFLLGIYIESKNTQPEKPEPRITVTAKEKCGVTKSTMSMLVNLTVSEMQSLQILKQGPIQIEADGVLYEIWIN